MQQNELFSERKIRQYSRWLLKAAKYGVSVDDMVTETKKYHGSGFTERVITKIKNLL